MYGQKFLRGQVWWIGTAKEYIGTVQSPNRPHVIVSNNVGNRSAGYVMVVPCTSEIKRLDMPTHLECEFNGKKNMIMCEQIKTVNVDELLSYMFTLDDSMLDKIDDALKIALGIVDRKSSEIKSNKEEFSDKCFEAITNSEPTETQSVIEEVPEEKTKITNIVELPKSKNGKYKVWDEETKREYINYYEHNGKKPTSEKYGVGFNAKMYYLRFCKALNVTPMEGVNGTIR